MPQPRRVRRAVRSRRAWLRRAKRVVSKAKRANIGRDVHYFKRMINNPGQFVGNALYTPLLQANSFNFNQLTGASEFTTLFDQYKIEKIMVKFFLKIDPSAQSAAGASYPKFYWVADHDDDTAAPTLNALREHTKCRVRVMNPNRPVTVIFKPSILGMRYKTVSTTGYSPMFNQWLDCNDSTVPHYGIKWGIDDLTNTNYKVDTEVTYWFACKDAR
jgi:hypothetical protein